MLPFIVADVGNILGGYFTQFIINKGISIPKARRIALGVSIGIMVLPLLMAPFIIISSVSALIIFATVAFGYTSYTANSLALVPDVIPESSAASIWGIGSIGSGLGGALFQSLSGITIEYISTRYNYITGHNYLFVGYGILALIGLTIVLFLMGSFHKNEQLHAYVSAEKLQSNSTLTNK